MDISLIKRLLAFFDPSSLTGPILDKELRVSSRLRRNYVLRSVYIILLLLFVILFWIEEVRFEGSAVYRSSRMSEAGKSMVALTVWFQFIASQLVAVVMLSSAISDEVYHRTLGVLMTTPINSFQIVLGKLLSKLLQLILLLAVSLPLLAIVRVFGGIPWDYIVKSFCITLSTCIFVGSLTLFFSIFCRRAYATVIVSILTLFAVFALIPLFHGMLVWLTGLLLDIPFTEQFSYYNPYFLLGNVTDAMMYPSPNNLSVFWTVCCIALLIVSAVILTASVIFVRRVALRQITGQLDLISFRKRSASQRTAAKSSSRIRNVINPPVLWKELRWPLFGRHKKVVFLCIVGSLIVYFLTYLFFENVGARGFKVSDLQIIYSIVFMGLGMLFTIVIPATTITSEKEAGSWQLLLTTTQSDWQIIWAKFIGAVRRSFAAWFFLFGNLIFFTFGGFIHPIVLVLMATLVVWVIVFLSCTGTYFSSRFRRTTTAVIMNFALAGFIWAFIPFVIALISIIFGYSDRFLEWYIDFNPFVQAVVIMEGSIYGGSHSYYGYGSLLFPSHPFNWPQGPESAEGTFMFMQAIMFFYVLIGLFLLWRAKRCLRKKIF